MKIAWIIIIITAVLLILGVIWSSVHAQNVPGDTIDQWKSTSSPQSAITTRISGKDVYAPYSSSTWERVYANCFWIAGSCFTGGVGSATSTNPFMATYFVATSTIATSTFPLASSTRLQLSDYLTIGGAPAKTGVFRLPNDSGVYFRDSGDSADFPVIYFTAANNLQIGDSGPATTIEGNGIYIDPHNNLMHITNDQLAIQDTFGGQYLTVGITDDLTVNRALKFTLGDNDRTITLNGSPTLNDWFDQSVKTTGNPTFAALTVGGILGAGTLVGGDLAGSGTGCLVVDSNGVLIRTMCSSSTANNFNYIQANQNNYLTPTSTAVGILTAGSSTISNLTSIFSSSTQATTSVFAITNRGKNANGDVLAHEATFIVSTSTKTGDFTDIASALAACPSGGECKLYVRGGTYTLSSPITISRSYVTIEGEGWNTIIKNGINLNDFAIKVNDASIRTGLVFRDFKVDGSQLDNARGGCIMASSTSVSTFDHLWLTSCKSTHLKLAGTSGGAYGANNTVTRNLFDNSGAIGLWMVTSDENEVYKNTFSDFSVYHVYDQGGTNTIEGNDFVGGNTTPTTGRMFYILGSQSKIIHNTFDGPHEEAIYADGSSNIIQGNFISALTGRDATKSAIFVANGARNMTQGNEAIGGGFYTYPYQESSASFSTVQSNYFAAGTVSGPLLTNTNTSNQFFNAADFQSNGQNSVYWGQIDNLGNFRLNVPTGQSHTFSVNGTTDLTVNSLGSTVVNATSTYSYIGASGLLDVGASSTILNLVTVNSTSTQATSTYLSVSTLASTTALRISGNETYESQSTSSIRNLVNALSFATSTATGQTPVLTLDGANGRVGIGSSSPMADFVVGNYGINGSSNAWIGVYNGVFPNQSLGIYGWLNGSSAFRIGTRTNNQVLLQVNDTEIARLTTTGTGIGTTSPFAKLSVAGVITSIPFVISTTSPTLASSTLFMVDKAGDVHLGGGTPVLSACGTLPTLDANATDQSGTITVGSAAASCTLTFSVAKLSKPHCNVTSQTGTIAISYTETTAALVITNATLGGDLVDYNCFLGH